MDSPRERVLFGAAYYHEYQPSPRLDTDLDLMAEAGFSVIRVGESVWTTWEPEEGRFDLDWLAPVLDGAHQRGIRVVLGTPTYAAPPWLARRYPEIAGETSTGQPMPWGGRQEIDYTHPAFKFYAERVIRKIVSRYADHPAVIGYQVDNEPGMLLFHNHGVFQRFVDELRHTYGTVEALNEAWGLVYWSHKLSTWSDLWTPDGNWQPQYDLAWRTFQAKLTTEFITWQADIVREYARDDQFVTTCIAYERPDGRRREPHPRPRRDRRKPVLRACRTRWPCRASASAPQGWTTSGAWSLFLSARPDVRLQAGSLLDHRDQRRRDRRICDQLPRLRRAVAAGRLGIRRSRRGDDRVLALAHQPLRHRNVLDRHPAARPAAGTRVRGAESARRRLPDSRFTCRRHYGRMPRSVCCIRLDPSGDWRFRRPSRSRARPVSGRCPTSISGPTIGSSKRSTAVPSTPGSPARLIHDVQIIGADGSRLLEPAALAAELPVLVVAGLLVADDALLTWLRDYAAAGGHLVIGPRTAYGDEEGRARLEVKPAHLAEGGGVRYQEFSNLSEPLPVVAETDAINLSDGATATGWVDQLISDGAKVIVGYEHPHFGRFPSVVSSEYGRGRITTVGHRA